MGHREPQLTRIIDLLWVLTPKALNVSTSGILDNVQYEQLQAYAKSEGINLTRQRVDRLSKSEHIFFNKTLDTVRLSRKGLLYLVSQCIKDRRLFPKLKENRCFVSFDIPEKQATKRNAFRGFLRASGFVQIHKSLWAHEYDLGSHVKYAAHLFRIKPQETYIFIGKTI